MEREAFLLRHSYTGADPGFQVRGGGALKIIAPSESMRENFGVFRVKNHDFTQKNHISSNFMGRAPGAPSPPPLDPPLVYKVIITMNDSNTLVFPL